MKNQTECLSKAVGFYQMALLSPTDHLRLHYTELADGWHRASTLAEWQDRFTEMAQQRLY